MRITISDDNLKGNWKWQIQDHNKLFITKGGIAPTITATLKQINDFVTTKMIEILEKQVTPEEN